MHVLTAYFISQSQKKVVHLAIIVCTGLKIKLSKNSCEALQFIEMATCFDVSNCLDQQHDEHSTERTVTTSISR